MGQRFAEWIAQGRAEEAARLAMAAIGLSAAVLWEVLRLWPDRVRSIGRAAFMLCGGLIYAGLFGLSIWTLVDSVFRHR